LGQFGSPEAVQSKRFPSDAIPLPNRLQRNSFHERMGAMPQRFLPRKRHQPILALLEERRRLPEDRRAELIRLASMLIEAMWRLEERKHGSEVSAV
jgi:hypothetical protein